MKLAATAKAHPNIALVKYWGKRDVERNIPAAGSLSITLGTFVTITQVAFDPALRSDRFELNGQADPVRGARVSAWLDRWRQRSEQALFAHVRSRNNFPTAAGLASSASGFAALTLAANRALGLDLSAPELSQWARLGSGSAARSIFGGYVEMQAGQRADGADAYASPLLSADAWPLRIVIAITDTRPKTVSSSRGMRLTQETSPYYGSWVSSVAADLERARRAVHDRDFAGLAKVAEASCLKMHGLMLASEPSLIYWNPATFACLLRVRQLRADGVPVFFTIDAGPQLKAICLPSAVSEVKNALAQIDGVREVVDTGLGADASIEAET